MSSLGGDPNRARFGSSLVPPSEGPGDVVNPGPSELRLGLFLLQYGACLFTDLLELNARPQRVQVCFIVDRYQVLHMASSHNRIEVELDTGAALRGVPMIALMLVPPNVNKVVLRTPPGVNEDGVADTSSLTGTKCPREVSKDTTKGPVKRARQASAGPSTIKLKGKPQYIPENEVLLVLPPMPKSLYNELTFDGLDSSLTEPESSEDERARQLKKL
ncbi:hypothetical protein EDB86DRAFT_2834591 [Lactarius hatsudake]|nr:hypothetical protein EDB86DRAFT_2834591 [Lactarius hatsudake]